MINPAKSQIGKISKEILQKKNKELRAATNLNQWQSTKQVINWFQGIQNKQRRKFLQFDIVEFYPSITEELLEKSFKFAERNGIPFTEQEQKIIKHSRRSLLYARSTRHGKTEPWQKQNNPKFDVTMGAPDGAEVCELVGLYILDILRQEFPMLNCGLYRDDGLAEHKEMRGREMEQISQKLHKTFAKFGLRITVEINKQQTDFLDVTLRLPTDDYKPYKKPNDTPLYVNIDSNHPPTVIKQIPIGINSRLSNISSNEQHFDDAKTPYQKALQESGHTHTLTYKPNTNQPSRKVHKRKVIWYNPPFNLGIRTSIGKKFLALVDEHFPKRHVLHDIINRGKVKISYSCPRNIKAIIQSHNQKILAKYAATQEVERECDCQRNRRDQCPLGGKCIQTDVVYQVTTAEDPPMKYIGSTEHFKRRYQVHTHSFRHEEKRHATTLSHHIWEQRLGRTPELKWEILAKAPSYSKGGRACNLCLSEKLLIMRQLHNPQYLNRRTELAAKCRHRAKFRLNAVK